MGREESVLVQDSFEVLKARYESGIDLANVEEQHESVYRPVDVFIRLAGEGHDARVSSTRLDCGNEEAREEDRRGLYGEGGNEATVVGVDLDGFEETGVGENGRVVLEVGREAGGGRTEAEDCAERGRYELWTSGTLE
jgi:hypothetical protein